MVRKEFRADSGGPRLPGSEYGLTQLAVQSPRRFLKRPSDMDIAGPQRSSPAVWRVEKRFGAVWVPAVVLGAGAGAAWGR